MTPKPFEHSPTPAPSETESERPERQNDAWMEHPKILDQALREVGGIISELQQHDEAIYVCLPLPERVMKGLARMYLDGIESRRLIEDLHGEVESTVRQACRAKQTA